jgi:hypothetical protein
MDSRVISTGQLEPEATAFNATMKTRMMKCMKEKNTSNHDGV